ncbi:HNH endonuclease signature motif containing protein [Gelidibacter sp.]|uniref:HNH endonuclease n=1 Tax=Gelidibacter sp. TaxID=2018083 RepID=UPI00326543B3
MEKSISQNDLELHQAFEIILSIKTFTTYISDIAEMIYKGSLNSENLNTIVNEYKIKNIYNGKCREFDNNQKLEFDHIIPFSKGGSNTYRNIPLLCEPCNRRNQIISDKI